MGAMSDYLEDKLRGHLFRATSFAAVTTLAVALFAATLTDASTGASTGEPAAAYARVSVTAGTTNWGAGTSTDGTTANALDITFPTATGSWGTLTYLMLADSLTKGAGNSHFYGALTASKAVASGEIFKINAGDLTVQLDN